MLPWYCPERLEALSTPFIGLDCSQPHLFLFHGAIMGERMGRLWRSESRWDWEIICEAQCRVEIEKKHCWFDGFDCYPNLSTFISLFMSNWARFGCQANRYLWLNTVSLLWTLSLSFRSFIVEPRAPPRSGVRLSQGRSGQSLTLLSLLSLFCCNSPALSFHHPLEKESQWQRCDKDRTLRCPHFAILSHILLQTCPLTGFSVLLFYLLNSFFTIFLKLKKQLKSPHLLFRF